MLLIAAAHPLVHVNAALNSLAAILLVLAYLFIKKGWETAHKNTMIAAVIVSIVFLACYVYYHFLGSEVRFTYPAVAIRVTYFGILLSHIILAITVPFFAVILTIPWHENILLCLSLNVVASWTPSFEISTEGSPRWGLPIWLYVSVTGVIVYVMLYHLWPLTLNAFYLNGPIRKQPKHCVLPKRRIPLDLRL